MVNMLSWLTGREDQTGQPQPFAVNDGQPSLRAYNPTPSERMGSWIQDLLMAGGAQPYPAGHMAHGVRDLLSMSPLGIGMSAADLLHAKSAGDPMGAAAAAIGMVPGLKPEVQAVRQGIRAYHGSPHDFDKFDIKRLGTGEGAQAYGHGLYFAENEGVARSYRPTIEPGSAAAGIGLKSGGKMYEVNINAKPEQFLDWDRSLREQPHIARAMQDVAPKPNWFQRQMEGLSVIRHEMATNPESTGATAYGALSRMTGEKGRATDMLREAGIPGIRYLDQGSRNMPAMEQRVQALQREIDLGKNLGPSYAKFNEQAQSELIKAKADLANMQPTSNYVLFNDQLVDIMRKYGFAAPAAAGATSYTMQPQEAQAAKAQAAQFQQPPPLSDRINQMIDSLQWGDQWQGRMRLPLERKVNNILGESVWPPLR